MALTPAQNEALIREVDDAVRQDNLIGFWRSYGRFLIGVIIGALAVFAGWLLWQNYQHKRAEEASAAFARMLEGIGGNRLDPAQLAVIKDSGSDGYQSSAQLTEAAVAIRRGDTKAAVALYTAITADADAPRPYRDLALVRRTALEFDTLKPDEIITRMKPLAVAGNPWFGSAGEMVAIAQLKAGRATEAGMTLASLTRDPGVSATIKLRAAQLAGTLGVDAAVPDPATN